MPQRVFFKMDDLPGNADELFHQGWIEVWNHQVTAGKAGQLSFSMLTSPASAILYEAWRTKRKFKTARLEVSEKLQVMMTMAMENLQVTSFGGGPILFGLPEAVRGGSVRVQMTFGAHQTTHGALPQPT